MISLILPSNLSSVLRLTGQPPRPEVEARHAHSNRGVRYLRGTIGAPRTYSSGKCQTLPPHPVTTLYQIGGGARVSVVFCRVGSCARVRVILVSGGSKNYGIAKKHLAAIQPRILALGSPRFARLSG